MEFGADSRLVSDAPGFLDESGEDGVGVPISMCNRRVDCAGPDWTTIPVRRRHPWSQKYGMSSTGFPAGSYWGTGVRGRSLLRLPRLKRLRTVRTLFRV